MFLNSDCGLLLSVRESRTIRPPPSIVGLTAFFAATLYGPYRSARSSGVTGELPFLARRALSALFIGLLLVCLPVLFAAFGTAMAERPMAALVAGLLIPILFVENYFADLFWNHSRKPDLIHVAGGLLVFLICSGGLLLATTVALGDGQFATAPFDQSVRHLLGTYAKSTAISLGVFLFCMFVVWYMAYTYSPELKRKQTANTPMHNMAQNFLQFWALFQILFIPVAIYVFDARTLLEEAFPDKIHLYLAGFTSFVLLLVRFPLKRNMEHKSEIQGDRAKYPSIDAIVAHINFQVIYSAFVSALVLAWLWGAYLKVFPLHT